MSVAQFLSTVANRDKVMGIGQFLPVVLAAPANAAGQKSLADGLLKLAKLMEGYRTVTRFSGMIDMATPENFEKLSNVKDPVMRKVAVLEFLTTFLFFPFEHLAMLATYNVIPEKRTSQFSGMAIFFWFWSLVIKIFSTSYLMLLDYPYLSAKATDAASVKRRADFRKKVLTMIKSVAYVIFAWSIFPAQHKPQLLSSPSGVLYPLHKLVEVLSPKPIALTDTTRGVLGMIAASCEFL